LDEITSRMAHEVDKRGGRIDEVYYCVHKSEDNCDCRKPKTGMLERAAKKHRIYFDETYFIGDSEVDVAAGRKLGCKTIFVLSGKTGREESEKWSEKPDYIFNDLLESVRWILARRRRKSDRALRRKMFKSKRQGDIGPVSKGED